MSVFLAAVCLSLKHLLYLSLQPMRFLCQNGRNFSLTHFLPNCTVKTRVKPRHTITVILFYAAASSLKLCFMGFSVATISSVNNACAQVTFMFLTSRSAFQTCSRRMFLFTHALPTQRTLSNHLLNQLPGSYLKKNRFSEPCV